MTDSYITVSDVSCEEIVINKSRFIGLVSPCTDESCAVSFIRKLKDEHRTARHHCYAYIIGENRGIMRYSDDGEPGGTAGLPIMDVLKQKSVVNCCAVVVRYFGGILLGTGGLVRAYTQAAQLALDSAGIVRMELTGRADCEIPYSCWDRFRYAAEHLPVRIENVKYAHSVCFQLSYRSSDRDHVFPLLLDSSQRKLNYNLQEDIFSPWEISK